MDAGGLGPQADPVAAALLDDLRLLQLQLLGFGNDDAVARGPHLLHGGGDLLVLGLDHGQSFQQGQKLPVAVQGEARLLGEGVIEQTAGQLQPGLTAAGAELHPRDRGPRDQLALPHRRHRRLDIPDADELPRLGTDGLEEGRADGMLRRQRLHPVGQEKLKLFQGKLIEDGLDDLRHRLLVQVQAADRQAGHVILLGQLGPQLLGRLPLGVGGVEQDEKGLAQRLQFFDDPPLGLRVGLPRQVGDGAVGRDDDADGGVLGDHFSGADLGGLRHGDLLGEPGGVDHSRLPVLQLPHGTGDQVAHAVHQAHGKGPAPLHGDLHGLLRHEFWLGGHHRPARPALGQFVSGPLAAVVVVDAGEDQGLHKALDKGGFPRPGRADHTQVDVPGRPGGNVLINACQGVHSLSPPSGTNLVSLAPCLCLPLAG